MENLLPERLKAIGTMRLLLGGVILLAVVLYFFMFRQPHLDDASIKETVLSDFKAIESGLDARLSEYEARAGFIFHRYDGGRLFHTDLEPKEALIITENNVIKEYFGEIYYFKFKPIGEGEWCFLEKKQNLFFMQKMAEGVFYLRYCCNLDDNFILDRIKFEAAVKGLQLFKDGGVAPVENIYQYDEARELFVYSHLLKGSNNQLGIYLRFSRENIRGYYRTRETLYIFGVIFGFLAWGMGHYYRKKRVVSRILWFVLLGVLFVFVSRVGGSDFYSRIGKGITFNSIYQVLVVLIALVSLVYWAGRKIKPKMLSVLLFNAALLFSYKISGYIFNGVSFSVTRFGIHYLALVTILFLLHLFPIFFLKDVSIKRNRLNLSGILLFQAVAAAVGVFFFNVDIVYILLLSVIACMFLFLERRVIVRVGVLFLVAISIYQLAGGYALAEKKEFIEEGLKNIFLNQNNYAKFIAREIVQELNLESRQFHEFFQRDSSSRLKSIWTKSIASRENIASGIFVLSPGGEILSHYSYQMQFLDVETQTIFPFWAIEDATAELYGEKTSLAVASINVVRESRHLGRIIVQVLNLPQLILRHQDKVNIFTIDRKIDGMDLSYIKLSEANQIVENPSNINLENVAGILKFNDQWITFRFIDIIFNGYIFRHAKDTYVIFFPANTRFKDFSEIIKIFLFLLVLSFLFYFRDLKKVDWKSIYYSFSIRVFSILILISLLTAVIFSLFSLNVNSQSSLRQSRQIIYERGRTAQNIGYNFLEEGDEFLPNHLLLISRILNTDVSVYEKGGLLETSNYRKIVEHRLPNFLHSNILQLLNRKNQKFVLLDDENGFRLYFKIYDYILDVEFSYTWRKILSEESYYTNFIITMFFLLAIIGFSSAFFFRNKILSPIDGLNRGMAEVEKGNLRRLKKIPSEIEVKNLYMGFNSMIEGIREQKKTISEMSRLKTIIKLGRQVAHEVKNPLTPIKLSAEQILLSLKDKNPNYEDIIKQSVKYIIDETDHLKKVSYGFLDLSRLDELNLEGFDLMRMLRKEVFNYKQIYTHIRFDLMVDDIPVLSKADDSESCLVVLDRFKIKQVLNNLINNSIDGIGERKGEIRVSLRRGEKGGERILLEVVDDGAGMDEDGMDFVYNFDYSTKEVGSGLGLFIVKRIIELHGGHIEIESERERGTRVILDLPVRIE